MSQNSNQTFGDWLRDLAEAAAIGAILMLIFKGFVMLASLVLPKGRNGQPNKSALLVVAMLMLFATFAVINAVFWIPKYHYIVTASPAEQRGMMQRKCIVQVTGTYLPGALIPNDDLLRVHCVALDAPDLPDDLQNQVITTGYPDASRALDQRGIKYKTSFERVGSYISNDPKQFHGTVWMWADDTRPRTEKYWYF